MSIVRFYCGDPAAPKPNRPTRLGVNALVEWQGRLLLERRGDSGEWGLLGGGVKGREPERRAMARELWEETGLRLPEGAFEKLGVFDTPSRIASYRDGSVWRMVIVLYRIQLTREPILLRSSESKELRFFAPAELPNLEIVCTHRDLVENYWLSKQGFVK